jgi:predicted dehydrogenase
VPTEDIALIKTWQEKYGLGRPVAARGEAHRLDHQKADGRWLDSPEKCPAAPVTRIGIYLINDLVRIFGPAKKAGVVSSTILTTRPTPDNAQLSILFENGGLGNVFASFCCAAEAGQGNSLCINFENGIINRDLLPGGETRLVVSALVNGKVGKAETRHVTQASGAYLWEAFYRAIQGEKFENEVTPEEIAEGIQILNAMAKSEKTGRFESVEH